MAIDHSRVEEVFHAASRIEASAERMAFLESACAGDLALRGRVEELLRAHAAASEFLERPAVEQIAAERRSLADAADLVDDSERALALLQPAQRPDSLGRLGHYEILEVLGQGGFGIVLRASDEILQRVVAIKMMSPLLAATSPARKRFLREARAAAAVRHENVVQIHAVEEQPIPYLVMEFIPGLTLQQRLDESGPQEVPEMLRLAVQISRGLAAAHEQGLIHRDIKPANILLEKGIETRAKLTDFGMARAVDDASLTQTGVVAGTPMYMAPEQALGAAIDQRADLFSLGSVFYVMLSGRPPFRASMMMAVLKRVAEDNPRPIREIIPEVPQWLCDIISKLQAKKPDDRFQSAREVADLLAKCLTQLDASGDDATMLGARLAKEPARDSTSHALPDPRRRKPWKRVTVLITSVVILASAAALWLARETIWREAAATPSNAESPQLVPPVRVTETAKRPSLPNPLELASRPAACDALDARNIPAELLAAASIGDPRRAPAKLVAIFGENKLPQEPGRCHVGVVAFSPDGKTLASGGSDKIVRLWDLATGKPQRELLGQQPPDAIGISTLAFSPDGATLAACFDAIGTIRIWNVSTGDVVATLASPGSQLHQLAYSPDGQLLAAARQNGDVQLWDVSTESLAATLPGSKIAWSVAFTPDGKSLAAGHVHDIHLWDVATRTKTETLLNDPGTWFRWLGFHPDGRTLATGGLHTIAERRARLIDVVTQREVQRLLGHDSTVLTGAWRADGQLLVTAAEFDGTIHLWDMTANPPRDEILPVIPPNLPWLHCLAFSPEGRHLAVSHPAGMILILRLAERGEIFRVTPAPLPAGTSVDADKS